MSVTPWQRNRPTGAVDVETDDDDHVTVDKWPREVFRPHYHDAEVNWLLPLRAGRLVFRVEDREVTIDGDRWIAIFPRVPHAVVHISDDCEVLSLFVPQSAMLEAYELLSPKPEIRTFLVGGEQTIAHGLALAWAEQRFAKRRRDPFDAALATVVAGWIWRHGGAPADDDAGLRLRSVLGPDIGTTVATFFDAHIADEEFPWSALAAQLGMSARTMQRRFAALGESPSQMLQRFRLARARELLADRGKPIGDIAIACGFPNQAHFATAFRAAFGGSPTELRKR